MIGPSTILGLKVKLKLAMKHLNIKMVAMYLGWPPVIMMQSVMIKLDQVVAKKQSPNL